MRENDDYQGYKATDRDWPLTYGTAHRHQIRVAFPPDDARTARAVITAATDEMGCTVLATTTHSLVSICRI